MSSNRLAYDTCAYKTSLKQSTGQLSHIIEPNRFYHCNQCRNELGLIGGNNVSQIRGNLVDLENDLRGTTRNASLCPKKHYQPACKNPTHCQPKNINVPDKCKGGNKQLNTQPLHLPPCQMISYKPVPLPPKFVPHNCPPNRKN